MNFNSLGDVEMMWRRTMIVLLYGLGIIPMRAQNVDAVFDDAIEDNSFFIEEAYNQEARVVQHISTLLSAGDPKTYAFAFTQEWPVGSQLHQLSATIPYVWLNGFGVKGFSDVLLNYRYQLLGSEDWAALAPRLSVILPAGDEQKGLGAGVWAFQINLPISKRLTNELVVHANLGATLYPGVKSLTRFGDEVQKTLISHNYGLSAIALISPQMNLMLEVVRNVTGGIDVEGNVIHNSETIVSPGIRAAIDVGSLQIVPGLGVPVIFAGGESTVGSFFYLSFEHPF